MDSNEIEKLDVGLHDEVEIVVIVYGHKIVIRGEVIYIGKVILTIRENEKVHKVLLNKIDELKILKKKAYETDAEHGNYVRVGVCYLDEFEYDFVEKYINGDDCVYKNYLDNITLVFVKILVYCLPKRIENEIVEKLLDSSPLLGESNDFLSLLKYLKLEIRKRNSDRSQYINLFKFCSEFAYVLNFRFPIEDNYAYIEFERLNKEFSLGFDMNCFNRARKFVSATPSNMLAENSNLFNKLLNRIDAIIEYLLKLLCEEVLNCKMRNLKLVLFLTKEYFGYFEFLIYNRNLLIKYLNNKYGYEPSAKILNFFNSSINSINDRFLRNIASIVVYNKEVLNINGVDDCEFLYNCYDFENGKFETTQIVQGKFRNFNLDLHALFFNSIKESVFGLVRACLIYKNYSSDLVYSKLKEKELSAIKGELEKYFKDECPEYCAENLNILSLNDIYKNCKEFFDYLFLCLTKILDVGVLIDEKFCDTVKNLKNLLSMNASALIMLSSCLRTKLIEFCDSLLVLFDRDLKFTFADREKEFEKFEKFLPAFMENISVGEDYIGHLIKQLFSFSTTFKHIEFVECLFYSSYFPNLDVNVDGTSTSYVEKNQTVFIPISLKNISNKSCMDLNIKSVEFFSGNVNDRDKHNIFLDNLVLINNTVSPMDSLNFVLSFKFVNDEFDCDDLRIGYKIKYLLGFCYNNRNLPVEEHTIIKDGSIRLNLNPLKNFTHIINVFQRYKSGGVIENDQMFFGRSEFLERISNTLENGYDSIICNRCICIYGQTRTGKSTLLFHLKKRLRSNLGNIIIDLGDLGAIDVSDASFRFSILQELLNEIIFEHPDLESILTEHGFNLEPDIDLMSKSPVLYFDFFLKKLNRLLTRFSPNSRIIILIDEFTYIYDWIKMGKVSEDFMKFWKALMQNYHISAVIVGQDHMMKFINDPRFTNSFGSVTTFEVNYLKPEYARQLVTHPVSRDWCGDCYCDYTSEAVNYLIELTSGSPFLLMNICSDFIDFMNEIHARYATISHVQEFIRRHLSNIEERLFEPLYNDKMNLDSLDSISENKRILAKIAHETTDKRSVKLEEMKISESDRVRIEHLTARHVLQYDGGGYRIQVKLYAMWLRRMTEKEDA